MAHLLALVTQNPMVVQFWGVVGFQKSAMPFRFWLFDFILHLRQMTSSQWRTWLRTCKVILQLWSREETASISVAWMKVQRLAWSGSCAHREARDTGQWVGSVKWNHGDWGGYCSLAWRGHLNEGTVTTMGREMNRSLWYSVFHAKVGETESAGGSQKRSTNPISGGGRKFFLEGEF